MATLGESKSARKHVGTLPASCASDLNEGNDEHFICIDKLQSVGINAADIAKLRGSGYCTVLSVIQTTKKDLALVKGLSEAKVEKIVEAAMKLELCNSFISGGELIARRAKVLKITTAAPGDGRRMRKAIIIVDSIMALFRVDFSGRGELADRQQKLNKMLNSLIKVSEQYNVSVVLTNQVMSDPGGGLTFVANPTKPVGGHVLGHASTTRLSLRKGKGDQRICKVYDAPNLAESECIFQLTAQGITDAAE
ncbi:meiotic recombination protein DMC1-like protein, putative [Eimeria tenella]|uniref:Meiotic recombination protein DMC1-like protein, putative n=1 Tax=Eimeria tenella TaxID=5802 RepID=U6L1C8_EIMTE|nr:meiotic recombination protein DMC1-like protein, putative [Eimeria tenella]CDJ42993.1 meiotic recombination protein DMC1-like protein, putative [Eimeria tenella]|eukprot:XP_013233743.1 meiotic recombination protein DMC1-like protein, putative [Eimeria tenella]